MDTEYHVVQLVYLSAAGQKTLGRLFALDGQVGSVGKASSRQSLGIAFCFSH